MICLPVMAYGALCYDSTAFYRYAVSNGCPYCYTVTDFCRDHSKGVFVLGFGGHCAAVIDGDLYDSWDSSNEIPQFYWTKELK